MPEQLPLSRLVGMKPQQLVDALNSGQFADALAASNVTPAASPEIEWLRGASPAEVLKALQAGKLDNLIAGVEVALDTAESSPGD